MDATVIAELVKNGQYSEAKPPTSILRIRALMNVREKVTVNLGQVQRCIQNLLDRFFLEYSRVFKDWEGEASFVTLHRFRTYHKIISLVTNEIAKEWKEGVNRAVGMRECRSWLPQPKHSLPKGRPKGSQDGD